MWCSCWVPLSRGKLTKINKPMRNNTNKKSNIRTYNRRKWTHRLRRNTHNNSSSSNKSIIHRPFSQRSLLRIRLLLRSCSCHLKSSRLRSLTWRMSRSLISSLRTLSSTMTRRMSPISRKKDTQCWGFKTNSKIKKSNRTMIKPITISNSLSLKDQ